MAPFYEALRRVWLTPSDAAACMSRKGVVTNCLYISELTIGRPWRTISLLETKAG